MSDAILMQWLKSQASLIHMLPKVAQGSLCKEATARTIGSGVVSRHYSPMSEPKGKADAVSTLKSEWNNGCYGSEKDSPTCPGATVALPVAPFHPVALCSPFQFCLPSFPCGKRCWTEKKIWTLLLGMTKLTAFFTVVTLQNRTFTLWHLYQAHTPRKYNQEVNRARTDIPAESQPRCLDMS